MIDVTTAKRMAHFGAVKMAKPDSGYRFEAIGEAGAIPMYSYHRVFAPNGAEYTVLPYVDNGCDCPFNEANGVCKHVYHVRRELNKAAVARTAHIEEELDAEERYFSRTAGLA